MQDTITIRKEGGGWLATYSGPHAAGIVDLFGVDTLPLPFTSEALASMVVTALRGTESPDCRIVLASAPGADLSAVGAI